METKEESFDLKELFEILKKRIVLILSITLISTLVSVIISYFIITPIYQAKTEILVNKDNKAATLNNGDIQANINLVNTYSVIIKSPHILDMVGNQLGLSEGQTAGLGGKITVNSVKNSQVISITVEDPSQKRATLIANMLAKTFQEEIPGIMNISKNNVSVLTVAKENPNAAPVKPNKSLYISIAFVFGLMLGIVLALVMEYLDNTIKTEKDIEKVLGLPVLGAVPQIQEKKTKKKSRIIRPYEQVAATRGRRA